MMHESSKDHFLSMRIWKPKVAVIQFFGLMTGDTWRSDEAIPFVKKEMKPFLQRSLETSSSSPDNPPVIVDLINKLRQLQVANSRLDDSTPVILEGLTEDLADSVISFYEYVKRQGSKNRFIKKLEDLIILHGLTQGSLTVKVYDDVVVTLRDWREGKGIRFILDCAQLSTQDTQVFLAKTNVGDLNAFFERVIGNDDKDFMTKSSNDSYANLIKSLGVPSEDLLFITQFGQRAKEMKDSFSIESVVVDRGENRKVRSYYLVRFPTVTDMREIVLVDRKKRHHSNI